MYQPKHFQTDRPELVARLMREHGFATLVSFPDGQATADAVPLLYEGDGTGGKLVGHVAFANPLRKSIRAGERALAIFNGPHCYVSPTLYVTGDQVPTWNYAVVHAHGNFRAIDDEARAESVLRELSDKYESPRPNPWRFEIPDWGRGKLLARIAVFEIAIERIDAKFKLSQNRDPADRESVLRAFNASADPSERDVARWMES